MGMMSNGNGNGNEETTLLVRALSKSCAKLMHVMLFHLLFKITHTHMSFGSFNPRCPKLSFAPSLIYHSYPYLS